MKKQLLLNLYINKLGHLQNKPHKLLSRHHFKKLVSLIIGYSVGVVQEFLQNLITFLLNLLAY